MTSVRPSLRTTGLVAAGVAGVVLAHGLDYLLIVRSSATRAATLAETGHGWWPAAVAAALGAACLATSMATARGAGGAVFRLAARTARPGGPTGPASAGRDLGWVALWQGGLFTAVEVLERISAHRSPQDLLHGPLFPAGLALQVLVAAAVVAALHLCERAGASVAGGVLAARSRRPRARRPAAVPPTLPAPVSAGPLGRHEGRGPPPAIAA